VKCFQSNFAIFFSSFFTNSENATKSKFRQETLNILGVLKFTGSHLAFLISISFQTMPLSFSISFFEFCTILWL
jgi:hypothetical protein